MTNDAGSALSGFMLGASLSTLIVCPIVNSYRYIEIPKNQEMQQGYVQPNKLEVVLSDLDNDGKKEFMLKYEGKSYLMTYENGKPQIREYEVKIPTKPSVEIKLK